MKRSISIVLFALVLVLSVIFGGQRPIPPVNPVIARTVIPEEPTLLVEPSPTSVYRQTPFYNETLEP